MQSPVRIHNLPAGKESFQFLPQAADLFLKTLKLLRADFVVDSISPFGHCPQSGLPLSGLILQLSILQPDWKLYAPTCPDPGQVPTLCFSSSLESNAVLAHARPRRGLRCTRDVEL